MYGAGWEGDLADLKRCILERCEESDRVVDLEFSRAFLDELSVEGDDGVLVEVGDEVFALFSRSAQIVLQARELSFVEDLATAGSAVGLIVGAVQPYEDLTLPFVLGGIAAAVRAAFRISGSLIELTARQTLVVSLLVKGAPQMFEREILKEARQLVGQSSGRVRTLTASELTELLRSLTEVTRRDGQSVAIVAQGPAGAWRTVGI